MKIVLDKGAQMPTKAHDSDAGYDLYASHSKYIMARGSAVIDTGVHVQIPKGFYGMVVGRSGLNFKESIICPQGTIDAGYTGSIKVKLYNLQQESRMIMKGDRIAQIIFMRCHSPEFELVEELDESDRGEGGFGSSGK